jgi:hypothetical protein
MKQLFTLHRECKQCLPASSVDPCQCVSQLETSVHCGTSHKSQLLQTAGRATFVSSAVIPLYRHPSRMAGLARFIYTSQKNTHTSSLIARFRIVPNLPNPPGLTRPWGSLSLYQKIYLGAQDCQLDRHLSAGCLERPPRPATGIAVIEG